MARTAAARDFTLSPNAPALRSRGRRSDPPRTPNVIASEAAADNDMLAQTSSSDIPTDTYVEANDNDWHLKLESAFSSGHKRYSSDPLASFKHAGGDACPMSWLEASAAAFPAAMNKAVEYLPDIDMSKCDQDVDAAIWNAQDGAQPSNFPITLTPPAGTTWTIGKTLRRNVEVAVKAAEEGKPSYRVGYHKPQNSKWASKLGCREGAGAWQCMFGERYVRMSHAKNKNEEAARLAKAFWESYLSSFRALGAEVAAASPNVQLAAASPNAKFHAFVAQAWVMHRLMPFTSGFKKAGKKGYLRACSDA
jgi:hypothetical protein